MNQKKASPARVTPARLKVNKGDDSLSRGKGGDQ